jgi:hypothetical protein
MVMSSHTVTSKLQSRPTLRDEHLFLLEGDPMGLPQTLDGVGTETAALGHSGIRVSDGEGEDLGVLFVKVLVDILLLMGAGVNTARNDDDAPRTRRVPRVHAHQSRRGSSSRRFVGTGGVEGTL